MLRFVICSFLFYVSIASTYAQESSPFLNSIDRSISSIFNNPAGLSRLEKRGVLLKHENPFLLKELQTNSIGICFPIKDNTFALSFEQFGAVDYILQYGKCSFGKSFGKLSGGIGFNYRHEFINDGQPPKHSLQIDLGLLLDISDKILGGFHIQNPGSNTEINDPLLMEIGFQYQVNTLCSVAIELDKENQREAIGKLCVQYKYYKNFELLFAIQSGTSPYRIGNSFAFKHFQCQINTSYHSHFGFGFQYLLSYQL